MTFFRHIELAKRLKDGKVTSGEKLIYFLVIILFQVLLTSSTVISSITSNVYVYFGFWEIIVDGFLVLSALVGTIFVYQINKKGDNQASIERYICLSFPISIHLVLMSVLFIIFLVVKYFLIEMVEEKCFLNSYLAWECFVFVVFVSVYFCFQLYRAIKVISSIEQ